MDVASLRAEYKRNGAVCLRGFLTEEWLTKAADGISGVLTRSSKDTLQQPYVSGTRPDFRDFGNWKTDQGIKEFVFKSPLARTVAELLESQKVTLYYDQILIKDPHDISIAPFHEGMSSYPFDGNQVRKSIFLLDWQRRKVLILTKL
jgi:hypothetical protein